MPRKPDQREIIKKRLDTASMRPRPDAAETAGLLAARAGPQHASMRPRPDAAETASAAPPSRSGKAGFNEAAARCRGNRGRAAGDGEGDAGASMRPRPDAAETGSHRQGPAVVRHASMRPRPDAAETMRR